MDVFYIFSILCERLTPAIYDRLLTQNTFVYFSQEGFHFRIVVSNSEQVRVQVSDRRTEILRRSFQGEHLRKIWAQQQRQGCPVTFHYG